MDKEFFNLVRDVRRAQRRYFAATKQRWPRKPPKEVILSLLEKSKALEKQLDEEIARIELENQPKLFKDEDFK